jgi:hypothetical protein
VAERMTGAPLIWVAFWCGIGALVGWVIGGSRGRATEGLWLGLFLGAIGWIIVYFMPPGPAAVAARRVEAAELLGASTDQATHMSTDVIDTRPCPWCAETIKAAARVCRYCGRDVEPLSVWSYASVEAIWDQIYAFAPDTFRRSVGDVTSLLRAANLNPAAVLADLCERLSKTMWASDEASGEAGEREALSVLAEQH